MEANRRTMDPDFAPELDHSEFDDDTEKQAQDLYDPELESEDLEDESNDSPEDVNDELEDDENEAEEKSSASIPKHSQYTDRNPEEDNFRLYLNEMGQYNTLTQKEEYQLARAYALGRGAEKILKDQEGNRVFVRATIPYLEKLEIGPDLRSDLRKKGKSTLRRYVEEGQEAKDKLIQCNLRLVLFVAKKYSHSKRSIEDLVQDGNIGLMTAVDRFDYTRGFKFSTYAYNWINQSITRELANQNKTIRIPVHLIERINQMHRAERALSVSLGYEPSDEEIAKKMECTVEQVRNMHAISQTIVSLDAPVGEDHESTYGDFIVDQTATKVDEEAERKDLQDKLSKVMDKALTEKEKAVLIYRFGLDGGEPMTLDEVGSIYHVTRERIRQIEAKALRKMRSPKYAKFLNDFRDDPHKKVEYNRYAW